MITNWAGNSLIIAIILIALASLVLGMGLPVTAAYIVLGTLSAPALYNLILDNQLIGMIAQGMLTEEAKAVFMMALPDKAALLGQSMGMEDAAALLAAVPPDLAGTLRELAVSGETATLALLSAHMIIFWLSQDSNVTPPVCLTAFTAAAIAKTPPMATGLESWRIAKGIYVMPILFAYTPFLGGSWPEVLQIFFFALIGLYALTGALQGYLEQKLSWLMRAAVLLLAFLLLAPSSLVIHLGAAACFAILLFLNIKKGQTTPLAA
jgi:TRAP-type uncharacterized transport system fused permease subunit